MLAPRHCMGGGPCAAGRERGMAAAPPAPRARRRQSRSTARHLQREVGLSCSSGNASSGGGRACMVPAQWYAAAGRGTWAQRPHTQGRRSAVVARAEKREYYDYRDMPPLPLNVSRIVIPSIGHTVVDKANEPGRLASLAIFHDIWNDEQYRGRLDRRSAITALCMYDREDVDAAAANPGDYPNIDLLQRVYSEGLEFEFKVEEL